MFFKYLSWTSSTALQSPRSMACVSLIGTRSLASPPRWCAVRSRMTRPHPCLHHEAVWSCISMSLTTRDPPSALDSDAYLGGRTGRNLNSCNTVTLVGPSSAHCSGAWERRNADLFAADRFAARFRILVCLLYTSDAADEEDSVDLGGR